MPARRMESRSFITDPYSGDSFEFQYNPPRIKDAKGSKLKMVAIPGSSQPRIHGVAGGERKVSFELAFFAEDADERNEAWVRTQVLWLRSLTYARVVNEARGSKRVTPAFLSLGQLLEFPAYLRNTAVTWGPFRDLDMMPMLAQCSLDFVEAPSMEEFIDVTAARAGSGMRRTWYVDNSPAVGNYLQLESESLSGSF